MRQFWQKCLKCPIFHASVHTHDAESDASMDIILKYNTCMIKPYRYHEQAVHLIFHHIWTSLYWPVLSTTVFEHFNTFEHIFVTRVAGGVEMVR